MLRASRTRSRAPAFLALACALVATGCIGDLLELPPPPAPAMPREHAAGLWALAPPDAVGGVVVQDGAFARALALWADPDPSPLRSALEDVLKERGGLSFNPLSPEAWTRAGLDPQKGAAAFAFADKKRGALVVLPVVDRTLFRKAFGLVAEAHGDGELDRLDDHTICGPAAGRYVCARAPEAIAATAPREGPLARDAAELEEHGEVEMLISRDAPDLVKLNHDEASIGWITAFTGALHLRDDGATLHLRAAGSLATPRARGLYAAAPPPDLAAAARGAASVARLHVDAAALSPPGSNVDPEAHRELLEQLTGDVEILSAGTGFANATITLPVTDAARVEAFVKKRCAASAAVKERRPLGDFVVSPHGCTAVFDGSKLLVPIKIPMVPIAVSVADRKLVMRIGDGGATGVAAPADRSAVEGATAKKALEDAETLLFFAHDLGIGPDVGAGAFVRDAVPLFGDRVASAVEAWDYVSAHVSQALATARVTDEGAELTIELLSFAGDPAAARAAYDAALKRRFAGDDAGYRAALASIEKSFPGTRAARRAALVRAGAPFLGAGVGLLGTLGALSDAGKKKPAH